MACIPPCPAEIPDAAPIERMRGSGFNWRGGEGSVTDHVAEDQREEDPVTYQAGEPLIFSSYTRPSTGLACG
ncbi:MAG: hypothetical protein ACE5EC_04835 [Phycisphaerae bacterium]